MKSRMVNLWSKPGVGCRALAAAVVIGLAASVAYAEPAADPKPTNDVKPAGEAKPAEKKHSKAEIEAFLTKCSQEADEKGLDVKKGKGAERKAFRRECMHKFGVDPK